MQEREHLHAAQSTNTLTRDDDLVPGQVSRSAALVAPENPVASGLLLRKAERDDNGVADGAERAVATAATSSGMALPAEIQRKFEGSLGANLSSVRVHTGSESQTAAHAVGAKAYTVGQDIHFGAGQYDPTSGAGEHLLAHEVAHTVQQQGGTPTRQNKLEVSSPGDAAEHEADRAADAMVEGTTATIAGHGGVQRQISHDARSTAPAPKLFAAPPPTLQPVVAASTPLGQEVSNTGVQQPLPTGTTQLSRFASNGVTSPGLLRPTPTPLDPGVVSAVNSIAIGQAAFGSSDWKKDVDWNGFSAWANSVRQVEDNITNTVNPKIGSDLGIVQHIHDEYQQRLNETFANERATIEQILKSDTTVMGYVTDIRLHTTLISGEFQSKGAALDRISEAAKEMDKAVAASEQHKVEDEKQKQQAYLDQVKAAKVTAAAELKVIPEIIAGTAKVATAAATASPVSDPAGKLAELVIMEAYKGWVDKDIDAKFETTINNIQFKIRNLDARIQNLNDTQFAAGVHAAHLAALAAGKDLQAANTKIGGYSTAINEKRVQLGIYVSQKYRQVASVRLATEATNAMKPVLAKYLGDLNDAKAELKKLDPWQQYYFQLVNAGKKTSGANWMQEGGALPQLGELHPPTAAQQQQIAEVNHYEFELSRVGQYVMSENAYYDREIEKVESGGYLEFVQQLDQQLVTMLPTTVPAGNH